MKACVKPMPRREASMVRTSDEKENKRQKPQFRHRVKRITLLAEYFCRMDGTKRQETPRPR